MEGKETHYHLSRTKPPPPPPKKIRPTSSQERRDGGPRKGQWPGIQVTWSPRENPRPDSYQVSFFFFFFPFLFFCFSHSPSSTSPCSNSSLLAPTQPPPGLASHIAQVEVSLLYPPVGWDLLGLVALHVLLHGGEAGAVLRADGALVGRGAVVRPQVLDHG